MKAMATSWRWPRVASASRFAAALILVGVWASTALAQGSTGWANNERARLSALADEEAVAVDWYWHTRSQDKAQGAELTARFTGPGHARTLSPLIDLSVDDPQAGLTTRILFVFDAADTEHLPGQQENASALVSQLRPGQELRAIWQVGERWMDGGELTDRDAISALAPPVDGGQSARTPGDLLEQLSTHRTFVILARGALASSDLGTVATERGERFYVISAGFPNALPGNSYIPLEALDRDGVSEALTKQLGSGRVVLFDAAGHYRLPGEPQGSVTVSLNIPDTDALFVSLPLNIPSAEWTIFFNPLRGFEWLATPGRRLTGLMTLIGWAGVLGAILFLLRVRYLPATTSVGPLAEIEIYSLGLSARVRRLPFTIGRASGCDLVIPDSETSRRHAEIRRASNGSLELIDLMSANGTFLESERLNHPAKLGPSQNVTFGGVRGHIRLVEDASTQDP